jgi:hypothetical protein
MYRWRPWLAALILLAPLLLAQVSPGGASAQGATPVATSGQEFTPVIPRVHTSPQWFPGSDGQVHLVYELLLTNTINVPVVITSLDIIDTATGSVIASLSGSDLEAATSTLTAYTEPTTTLAPSTVGVVWLDIPLDSPADIPATLTHTLKVSVPPGLPIPESITFTGAETAVDTRAPIVLGAPLQGPNWAAIGSCCDGPHRRSFQPIDGELYLAQRFAIDFNLLDAENRLSFGDPALNESYPSYGQPVIAVADATVVQAVDGLPEQTPGSPLVDITLETADGNHVILDLGNGAYAFYAHLKTGTVAVEVGDTVQQGDLIGELGNTGSSDGAHLHFHVMDAPSALAANGLPYVFADYDLTGQLPSLAEMAPLYAAQASIPVDPSVASPQVDTLPLGGNVMTFPEPPAASD